MDYGLMIFLSGQHKQVIVWSSLDLPYSTSRSSESIKCDGLYYLLGYLKYLLYDRFIRA